MLSGTRDLVTQDTERAEVIGAFLPGSLGLPSACALRKSLWECSITQKKIKRGTAEANWTCTSPWHQTGYTRGGWLMSL